MATTNRDGLYWKIYKNVKAKHPDWTTAKIHAVAGQLRRNYAVETTTE